MAQGLQQLLALVQRADRQGSLALATQLLSQGLRHPLVLMLAAEQLEEKGRVRDAAALLKEALTEADGEPEIWRRYGVALGKLGLLGESREALEEAFDIDPDQPVIRLALASACYRLGDLAAAEGHFAAVASATPQSTEAWAALAVIAAQRGDGEAARTQAERALAISPDNILARIALARAAYNGGDAREAEALADALLKKLDSASEHRLALLGLRADARDALGRHDDAFIDYSTRNAMLVAQYTPALAATGSERRIDQARRLHAWASALEPTSWAAQPAELARPVAGHLFIVGFPRSGTTLLEKALAGHSAIRTLPEVDCLGDAATGLLADADGLARLASLPEADRAAMRDAYFAAAAKATGDLTGAILVDKMPLNTVNLPVIARLFPDARIVLSLRDPRDVVLSGFRRRFQMNGAMFELLTLSGAAAYYDAVMALAESYRRLLPHAMLEVRHEDLVDDFDGQVSRVLDLVGLAWEDDIRTFAGRAAADARTPSDYQLQKGLSRDGVGTWRHYGVQLGTVHGVLAPWIARWGYPQG